MEPLGDLRVIEFSTEVAGPYCTKLLADAGADVIKVEAAEGDPLRRWSSTGGDLGDADGALFRFLNQNKRSVIGAPDDPAVFELVRGADLVVESLEPGAIDALDWTQRLPGLVLLSLSPYGRGGPWARRPWSEFTIQAESGSIGTRGLPGREPFQCGGRIGEWVAGTYAGVAALAAVVRARRTGHGERIDVSMLEAMALAGTNYMDLFWQLLGAGEPGPGLPQSVETPSIEPTADGYVGFCTNSRQQFSDFLLMIERPDLQHDPALAQVAGRAARFDEWNEIVHAWTRRHTTAEIVEKASLLRIPVAPVNDGDTLRHHEQLVERGVLVKDASGTFLHPRRPYLLDHRDPPAFRPAPRLGEHTGRIESREVRRARPRAGVELPLAGLRIVDMTNWWAGPSASQMLAFLGAEVIHVESTRRPDGMRMVGGMFASRVEQWWESSHFFLGSNTNKLDVTLDLTSEAGQRLIHRLIERSDALVENFTPRVLRNFRLEWETLQALNPRLILVRMPAFGLSGPWRDHTGFAQTMEQLTGLAWITGHRDDQPRIQRGPCDPLAGMHAAYALLVALAQHRCTGEGVHVESTMVEAALNAAAEQLIEFTAYGNLMQRDGNRCPEAAPQGLYACRGSQPGAERWLALSVHSDVQWDALCEVLGRPAWAAAPAFGSLAGRRAAQAAIDARLRSCFAAREREALAEELREAGVPAAPLEDPRVAHRNPQHQARGFFESFRHPVVGNHRAPTVPFRYASVEHWLREPAPTLGQHNRAVLGGLLGLGAAELASLEEQGVIGTTPVGL